MAKSKATKKQQKKNVIGDQVKAMVKSAVKTGLREAGGGLGAYVGSKVGNPIAGRKMGMALGQRISRLIGSGEYTVNASPTVNSLVRGSVPTGIKFQDRVVRLTHREYIGDVFTSSTVGAFSNVEYPINASYDTTFPFLAAIAAQYEQYRFHGLVFEFVSTCSNYIAGSSLGSLVIASQFNTSLPVFQSKTQMENCENAISARMDRNVLYGVECAEQAQKWYYTRHIAAGPGLNSNVANIYDLCNVQVATVGGGVPASTAVGELWVSYDVELTGPRLPDRRSGYLRIYATDYTNTLILGSAPKTVSYGIFTASASSSSVISLNNSTIGDIISITSTWRGTGSVTGAVTVTVSGLTAAGFLTAGANVVTANGGTVLSDVRYYTVSSTNATITYSAATLPTSPTGVDVVVTTLAYGVSASSL